MQSITKKIRRLAMSCLGIGLLFPNLFSQNEFIPAYPIRVNHKWGYINIYDTENRIHQKPIYDFIGDINLPWNSTKPIKGTSPYKVFVIDEKMGLMNEYLEKIIPSQYNRIRVLQGGYFAVETDSLFQLINSQQKVLLNGDRYQNICLANQGENGQTDLFFVKKEMKWGITDKSGKSLLAPTYVQIQSTELNGFFKVKKTNQDTSWQLINLTGTSVLSNSYRDIKVLSEQLVSVKIGELWYRLLRSETSAGKDDVKETPYKAVEKINQQLAQFLAYNEPILELRNTFDGGLLKEYKVSPKGESCKSASDIFSSSRFLPWFFPIDKQYSLQNVSCGSALENLSYLVDNEGKVVSPPFENILPSGKSNVYRVSLNGKWGLFAPQQSKAPIVSCSFMSIEAFKGNIAITRSPQKYGALSMVENQLDTLVCMYQDVKRIDDTTVEVQFGEEDYFRFQVDNNGQFQKLAFHQNGPTMRENSLKMREAEPLDKKEYKTPFKPKLNYYQLLKDTIFLVKETRTNPYDTKKEFQAKIAFPKDLQPAGSLTVIGPNVVTHSPLANKVENNFIKKIVGVKSARLVYFFDAKKAKDIVTAPIIGYRPFPSSDTKQTAFLALDGQMGLINQKGEEFIKGNTPVRYPYIGPYVNGLARVCFNGKLGIDPFNEKVPLKFRLYQPQEFINTFQMRVKERKGITTPKDIYLLPPDDEPLQWGFIDERGNIVFKVAADYVGDFHAQDKTAFIYDQMQKTENSPLSYLVGAIDSTGQVIIPKNYRGITRHPTHFTFFQDNTPVFYYLSNGHQIFVNKFRPLPTSEGFAQFRDTTNLWGFFDKKGTIIPPKYQFTRPFSDNVALVVDSTGFCGFIDQQGQLLFQTKVPKKFHKTIGDFKEDRCWFRDPTTKKWGCYNKTGKIVIPPKYTYKPPAQSRSKKKRKAIQLKDLQNPLSMDFSQGLAIVRDTLNTALAAIITKDGKILPLEKVFKNIQPFNQSGIAIFTTPNGQQGLINTQGAVINKKLYPQISPFINNYARVKNNQNKWGLINQKGEAIIAPSFQNIGSVNEGMVIVQTHPKEWQFFNLQTKKLLSEKFKRVQPFRKGYAYVTTLKGKNKIIDQTGKALVVESGEINSYSDNIFEIKTERKKNKNSQVGFYSDETGNNLFGRSFSTTTPFINGVATVRIGESRKFGAINTKGVMVVPVKYAKIHIHADGNIGCNPQRFMGLLNKKGEVIIEPKYDRIEQFTDEGLYRVERGEKVGYLRFVDGQTEWIWDLQQ